MRKSVPEMETMRFEAMVEKLTGHPGEGIRDPEAEDRGV